MRQKTRQGKTSTHKKWKVSFWTMNAIIVVRPNIWVHINISYDITEAIYSQRVCGFALRYKEWFSDMKGWPKILNDLWVNEAISSHDLMYNELC